MIPQRHFHADIGSHGALNCGPLNRHDASCDTGLFTDANEGSCERVTETFPLGKPHRCVHVIPGEQLEALLERLSGLDIWVLEEE